MPGCAADSWYLPNISPHHFNRNIHLYIAMSPSAATPKCPGCGSRSWDNNFGVYAHSFSPHAFFYFKNVDPDTCCERCAFLLTVCHQYIDPADAHEATLHLEWFAGIITSCRGVLGPTPYLRLQRGEVVDYPQTILMPVYSDDWDRNMGARTISHDSVDYDFIKSWIYHCDYGHDNECQKRPVPVRPLVEIDVIHCATRRLVPVQLFSPSGHPSLEFVTLSYLWGPPQAAGQTSVVDGRIPDNVPRVIEDAITVVTKLGLEYLWIDRYCIPQNNPVVRNAQIQQMGEIYVRSALTIIAAAGTGPDHGLPGVSVPRIPQLSAQIGKYTIADLGFLVKDMWRSKWDTRAWTYQEGLLSARRLVFTDHAVYFQCREMYCYENLTLPIYDLKASHLMTFDSDRVFNRIFPVSKSPPGELMKRITTLFKREISYDADLLDTLVGIFAEFRDRPRKSNEWARRGSIISPACRSPEVPLDRVDTLYGLPLYHRRAFQNQYNSHLSPTARLILALCWDISGGILRRKIFPSWL
jgi:hypothetical protein